MKEERKQRLAQNTTSDAVRYLFVIWQSPPLENDGNRAWNARTVPVGRRFARFAVAARVLWSRRPVELHFGGRGGGSAIETRERLVLLWLRERDVYFGFVLG